jgi:hypothetical protein
MSSRAFERLEEESSKAYRAFAVFRDLGPDRSLRRAAQLVYGSAASVRQLSRWSARFDWVARAMAFDDWATMIGRQAIEHHLQEKAEDHARREAALREQALVAREQALQQSIRMLEWPLVEQRAVEEDEDGNVKTLVFVPASWRKADAVSLYNMAVGNEISPEEEAESMIDVSSWSDEDLKAYLSLMRRAMEPKPPSSATGEGS